MPTPLPLRRSTRDSKPNSKYAANALTSCSFALLVSNLFYYEEAVTDPEWCEAMNEELMAIQKNQTWDMVTLPEGKNAIGLKWLYRTKYNADGTIQKYKAG